MRLCLKTSPDNRECTHTMGHKSPCSWALPEQASDGWRFLVEAYVNGQPAPGPQPWAVLTLAELPAGTRPEDVRIRVTRTA